MSIAYGHALKKKQNENHRSISSQEKYKNVTLSTSGSMLTSMKMEEEGEQGCHQLDDYSYSILEGILPQVIILV